MQIYLGAQNPWMRNNGGGWKWKCNHRNESDHFRVLLCSPNLVPSSIRVAKTRAWLRLEGARSETLRAWLGGDMLYLMRIDHQTPLIVLVNLTTVLVRLQP
jgi:hypothetical protein